MKVVVLRSVSFVMTPPTVSTPMSKRVTCKSSRSCTCEDASPERVTPRRSLPRKNVPRSGVALVELLQVSREAELIATPKPAPTTPEKAPKPGAAEEDRKDQQCDMTPRKHARAQSKPTSEATPSGSARSSRRKHIKYPATWSAWRLCAADDDACREHAD